MKKALFILLFLLPASLCCIAQTNLVPNPSFEENTGCPQGWGFYELTYWFLPTSGSSDYYHACGTLGAEVPNTWTGYQPARTGDAYAGMVIYSPNGREYIEVKLTDSLEAGKKYCAEFYVSLADNRNLSIGTFGMYFSQDSLLGITSLPLVLACQVENPELDFLSDKNNWMKVSGSFTAQGGEKFITIGNFRADSNTPVDTLATGSSNGAYYFIDDVSVYLCEPVDTAKPFTLTAPNVFTPNGDNINDVFELTHSGAAAITFSIFDRWGIKMYESAQLNDSWDGRTTSGAPASEGIYYYVIIAKDEEGLEHRRTGFVHLMR